MTRLFWVEQWSVFVLKLLICGFLTFFYSAISAFEGTWKGQDLQQHGTVWLDDLYEHLFYTFWPILNQRDYHLCERKKRNFCLKQESTPEALHNQILFKVYYEVRGLKDSS